MKEKIVPRQLLYLLILLVVPTVIMYVSGIAAGIAAQDAWLGIQIASLVGAIVVYLAVKLGSRFPGLDFGEICCLVLGKYIGKLIILYYTLWCLYNGSTVLREAGNLMTIGVMPRTPLSVFLFLETVLAVTVAYLGLEVLARAGEIILPVMVGFLFFLWALTFGQLDWVNLTPVFAEGLIPVVRASLPSIAFRGELFMIIFFFPFLQEREKAQKIGQWSVQLIGILLTINVVFQIAFFGAPELARMVIPTLTHAKAVEVGEIFERIEILLVAFWLTGITMKIGVFFFVSLQLFSQLFGVKDYRSLIIPTGLLYFVFSIVQFINNTELRDYIADYFFPFSLPIQLLIPLLLLLIALIRGKGGENAVQKDT